MSNRCRGFVVQNRAVEVYTQTDTESQGLAVELYTKMKTTVSNILSAVIPATIHDDAAGDDDDDDDDDLTLPALGKCAENSVKTY